MLHGYELVRVQNGGVTRRCDWTSWWPGGEPEGIEKTKGASLPKQDRLALTGKERPVLDGNSGNKALVESATSTRNLHQAHTIAGQPSGGQQDRCDYSAAHSIFPT